jgi:hypothetical protein
MSLEFAVEAYSDVIDEMRLMYPAHWMEVDHGTDTIPLDVNYERYVALELAGMLHVATARSEGELVGYHIFIVRAPQHHMSTLMAFSDATYLKPRYRLGFNGIRFLRFAGDSTRSAGARGVYISSTTRKPFGRVLEWLGFTETERIYYKDL